MNRETAKALEDDGEKLRQLTGKDHGPEFVDARAMTKLEALTSIAEIMLRYELGGLIPGYAAITQAVFKVDVMLDLSATENDRIQACLELDRRFLIDDSEFIGS